MTFSPQHRNSPQNLNSPLIRIDCSISIQILTFPNIVFHRLRACKIHPASIRPWYIEICAIHTTSDENNDNFHSTPSCVVVCGKLPATNYIAMRPLKWDTNQTSHITGRNNKQCASHNNLLIGITLNVPITHTHTHLYFSQTWKSTTPTTTVDCGSLFVIIIIVFDLWAAKLAHLCPVCRPTSGVNIL